MFSQNGRVKIWEYTVLMVWAWQSWLQWSARTICCHSWLSGRPGPRQQRRMSRRRILCQSCKCQWLFRTDRRPFPAGHHTRIPDIVHNQLGALDLPGLADLRASSTSSAAILAAGGEHEVVALLGPDALIADHPPLGPAEGVPVPSHLHTVCPASNNLDR